MKVIRPAVLGFCIGVRRAVELGFEKAQTARKGERIYTLGPLIHNPSVLANLKRRGIKAISSPPFFLKNCTLIIRAHGIDPALEEKLRLKNVNLLDATCPKVKKSQIRAKELAREGYALFLAGEARHAEIAGITGYARYYSKYPSRLFCEAVSNPAQAKAAALKLRKIDSNAKTALIAQTTVSVEEYCLITGTIKEYFPDLLAEQSICGATKERQQALRDLLPEIDAVIIAGGKDSSNSRRLFSIAKESGKPCALIESAAEIPAEFYYYAIVGLCAGASTPDDVIDEIEQSLKCYSK
ncbi:MAG: 4-hydroxy-3-methylbut-2-enyl diphosphate reductase [Treponema sp.]|jgi:4-hydroxy-3-methylbut-2-enyl diphosphate reductase|nr:4-hydroxy-3-methylbut-2-enyl diphosphate reductase [Treponema sp.]